MTTGQPDSYIELSFRPNIEFVGIARRFVWDAYGGLLGDMNAGSRIALATHELLENAVKYSADGGTTVRIQVLRLDEKHEVVISTRNAAAPDDIREVCRLIDEMNAVGDAGLFYQELMVRNAKRTSGSGLGLVRICAEGEMQMSYTVEGSRLTLTVRGAVAAAPNPVHADSGGSS